MLGNVEKETQRGINFNTNLISILLLFYFQQVRKLKMSVVYVVVERKSLPDQWDLPKQLFHEIEKLGIKDDYIDRQLDIITRQCYIVKFLYDKDYFPWELAPYLKGKVGSGKPTIQRVPTFRQTIVTLKCEDDKTLTSWFPTDEETKSIHHRLGVPLEN